MEIRQGIIDTATALGVSPVDLATVISYETGGTFDPAQPGPTTQFGQHRGLIQFGEPQAVEHGVDWNNAAVSQLGADGAIASYMRNAGVQPGMGLLDLYSAVNAGRVGRYNASDEHNGGAWGTVADKVNFQMSGHKRKAADLLGGKYQVASDTMRALGREPKGNDMTTRAQTPSLLGNLFNSPSAPDEEKRLLGGLLSEDKRDHLITALEGMTLNPNRALMAQATERTKDRRETKRETAARNKTADWLRSRGREDLASAVETGALSGNAAAQAAMRQPERTKYEYNKDLGGYVDPYNPSAGAVDIPGFEVPETANVKGEESLRKEFIGMQPVKEFQKQAQAYGRIVASSRDPSAAGDLALIFNYMKLLDPGSVVREGEFATAQNAAGVPERVRNVYRRVMAGERLSEGQRQDFVGRSAMIYQQAETDHSQLVSQYELTATDYGYDTGRTIPDFRYRPEGAPPTSARPQADPSREYKAPVPRYSQEQLGVAIDKLDDIDREVLRSMVESNSSAAGIISFLKAKGVIE